MIILKTDEEIEGIRKASRLVAQTLEYIESYIRPGVTTSDLNQKIDAFIRKHGGLPAFLGYRGYPASSCISLNHEVVHGIPSRAKVIRSGDLVKIDIGVIFQGYIGDAAKTFVVGEVPPRVRELVETTRKALYKGITMAQPGHYLSEISKAIQEEVEAHGFSVVRELAGHGVGLRLHEDPSIPNFVDSHRKGPKLKPGMVLAIEPMVNMGTHEVRTLADGWTVVTADGQPSAHFEHTVAILADGPEILTEVHKSQWQRKT